MKTRTTLGVASAVVIGGAGALATFTAWVDPTWVCERRADRDFEQLQAFAAPLMEKDLGEASRDLECWGSEPKAALLVRLPRDVSPQEAMTLLGDEWQVDETERGATTVDGVWETFSHHSGDSEGSYTKVVFHRS